MIREYRINETILNSNIRKCGKEYVLAVCREEPAELIQAISKTVRQDYMGYTKEERLDAEDNLVEEMADTIICIENLLRIYNINWTTVQREIGRKQEIQMMRIRGELNHV